MYTNEDYLLLEWTMITLSWKMRNLVYVYLWRLFTIRVEILDYLLSTMRRIVPMRNILRGQWRKFSVDNEEYLVWKLKNKSGLWSTVAAKNVKKSVETDDIVWKKPVNCAVEIRSQVHGNLVTNNWEYSMRNIVVESLGGTLNGENKKLLNWKTGNISFK